MVSFGLGALSDVVMTDRMEDSMQRRAHLPVSDLALGSGKAQGPRPPQRGQLPAPKPAHRDLRPPRALPNLDRSRPAVNIPQRRRMGVQR
jgi:hypothetical protein